MRPQENVLDTRVLAILVAHDGSAWVGDALDALESQTVPVEVVAVDNGSQDGTRELLLERLGERLLVADRDLGFGAAIGMALDSALAATSDADLVLFVHDDLMLEPDAVEILVQHLDEDPRLAIVGPKLVQADEPRLLQQVGLTIDMTGRTDSGLEPDELDQGQRDRDRPVLYVSTAGMLVRRSLLDEVGRFDRRYHVFRDDLDLCWRTWLAGHDVEVAPDAVGRHVRAVSNFERLGQTAQHGPRYFSERNTLATLLKCYGALRLAVVIPLFFVVGAAKVAGFLATRRFADAWQTVRAWGWNVGHLRSTLRLRRPVQERRTRTDGELRPLFARIAPRLRAYGEAIADRVSGGDFDVPVTEEVDEDLAASRWLVRAIRLRPAAVVGAVLLVIGLISAIPLLTSGAIRGGDLAPWPETSRTFLRAYASGWNDVGGMGSAVPPSPAQALLGLFGVLALGSGWLAPRLLILLPLPIAWMLALRAARLVTPRRLPRLVAATAYVLSPPAFAAATTGRLGATIFAALLPALVLAGARLADVRGGAAGAWRATAVAALLTAVVVSFEPPAAVFVLLVAAVGLVAVAGLPAAVPARRSASARILAAVAGAFILLLPWSVELLTPGGPLVGGFSDPVARAAPFLDWVLLAPDLPGFPGPLVGVALPTAALLALLVAYPRRPLAIGSLWVVALLGTLAAWGLGRSGSAAAAWPGLPLLVTAAAYAGALAIAVTTAGEYLTERAFGWRQVVTGATAVTLLVSIGGAVGHLITDPWNPYLVSDQALPAFIGAGDEAGGPYRVLVVADRDGEITWDLTGSEGPTMLRYGAPEPPELVELVDGVLADIAAQVSPAAGARLGLANIRYVYVPEGGRSDALGSALGDQFDLEPQPVEHGLVYEVGPWLPRAAYVSASVAVSIARRGEVPPDAEPTALDIIEDDTYVGAAPSGGAVFLAEAAHPGWEATVDGQTIRSGSEFGLTRFTIPGEAQHIEVHFDQQRRRSLVVLAQTVAALLAVSLVLRPPGFTEETT